MRCVTGLQPAERQLADSLRAALGSISMPDTVSSARMEQSQQLDVAVAAALAALSPAAAASAADQARVRRLSDMLLHALCEAGD